PSVERFVCLSNRRDVDATLKFATNALVRSKRRHSGVLSALPTIVTFVSYMNHSSLLSWPLPGCRGRLGSRPALHGGRSRSRRAAGKPQAVDSEGGCGRGRAHARLLLWPLLWTSAVPCRTVAA